MRCFFYHLSMILSIYPQKKITDIHTDSVTHPNNYLNGFSHFSTRIPRTSAIWSGAPKQLLTITIIAIRVSPLTSWAKRSRKNNQIICDTMEIPSHRPLGVCLQVSVWYIENCPYFVCVRVCECVCVAHIFCRNMQLTVKRTFVCQSLLSTVTSAGAVTSAGEWSVININ